MVTITLHTYYPNFTAQIRFPIGSTPITVTSDGNGDYIFIVNLPAGSYQWQAIVDYYGSEVTLGGTYNIEASDFYKLTIKAAQPANSGSVYDITEGWSSQLMAPGVYDIPKFENHSYYAVPRNGYEFDYWISEQPGSSGSVYVNPYLTATSIDTALTPVFKIVGSEPETVTLTVVPNQAGVITPGSGVYEEGTPITVAFTADPQWTGGVFSHWLVNGQNAGSENPLTIVMNSNVVLEAVMAGQNGAGISPVVLALSVGGLAAVGVAVAWYAMKK